MSKSLADTLAVGIAWGDRLRQQSTGASTVPPEHGLPPRNEEMRS